MSAILIGLGQIKEGQIAAAQGKFADKIAQRNQRALERQAKAEVEASKIEEARIARRSKIVQAQLAVGQFKSGIGLAGATIESLTDAAFQFSLDRNLTLRRGLIRSRELIQRGKIIRSEGKFAKVIGKQRRTAAFFKAGASFASQFGGGTAPTTGTPASTNIGTSGSVSSGVSPAR
jgi:hypothetical protein